MGALKLTSIHHLYNNAEQARGKDLSEFETVVHSWGTEHQSQQMLIWLVFQ